MSIIMMMMDFKYLVELQRYFKLSAKILGDSLCSSPAVKDIANTSKEEFCSAEIPSVTHFPNYN